MYNNSIDQPVVSVNPGEDYGSLRLWSKAGYVTVCDDDFGDIEATVACRDMGYAYGTSICCSAFGEMDLMTVQVRDDLPFNSM